MSKLADELEGLERLKGNFERIAAKAPDEQPHYPNGVRPWGSGDLRENIETLERALAALRRVEKLEAALECIVGYEHMATIEWERRFPEADDIMAPLEPSELSRGFAEIARQALTGEA